MDLSKISDLIARIKLDVSTIDDAIIKVYESNREIITKIHEAAENLFNSVRRHERRLIHQVEEIAEEKLKSLRGRKDEVQQLLSEVQNTANYAEAEIASAADTRELTEWKKSLLDYVEGLNSEGSETNRPTVEEDSRIEFHFLYKDKILLDAICNFGAIVTGTRNLEQGQECSVKQNDNYELNKSYKCADKEIGCGHENEMCLSLQEQEKARVVSSGDENILNTTQVNDPEKSLANYPEGEQKCKELITEHKTSLRAAHSEEQSEISTESPCNDNTFVQLYNKEELLIEKVNKKAESLDDVEAKLSLQYIVKEQMLTESPSSNVDVDHNMSCHASAGKANGDRSDEMSESDPWTHYVAKTIIDSVVAAAQEIAVMEIEENLGDKYKGKGTENLYETEKYGYSDKDDKDDVDVVGKIVYQSLTDEVTSEVTSSTKVNKIDDKERGKCETKETGKEKERENGILENRQDTVARERHSEVEMETDKLCFQVQSFAAENVTTIFSVSEDDDCDTNKSHWNPQEEPTGEKVEELSACFREGVRATVEDHIVKTDDSKDSQKKISENSSAAVQDTLDINRNEAEDTQSIKQ